jgi:hypothetical protein
MVPRRLFLFAFVLAGGALLPGCSKGEVKPSRSAGRAPGAPMAAAGNGAAGTLEATAFTATVKGRVTYNGTEPPKVQMYKTSESIRKYCPPEVPTRGWYCDGSSDKKGVRYAVVFLKPADNLKMPRLSDAQLEPPAGQKVIEIGQPRCQFEPRVVVLGPRQDIKFNNDAHPPQAHDTKLSGAGVYSKQLQPGQSITYEDVAADDGAPYGVSCNMHSGFMNAYVWKFKHPFAAVTNDDGQFEIKNCPVPINGKLELWVWHEMLDVPGNRKLVRALDLQDGGTEEVNIAIPRQNETTPRLPRAMAKSNQAFLSAWSSPC